VARRVTKDRNLVDCVALIFALPFFILTFADIIQAHRVNHPQEFNVATTAIT